MSSLLTDLTFKQRVFLALKHACTESRTERVQEKFREWKLRCIAARDRKYYQQKKLMVERMQGVRAERLVKQCFDAIRYGNVLEKYEATRNRLGNEIPIREELERKRDLMIKNHRNKDKYHALRRCCIRYADAKYRAMMVWKENILYFKRTMNRAKIRLIELHRRNLSVAFSKWREGSDRKHMVELLRNTDDLINENQELKNTLSACHQEEDRLAQAKFRQQSLKVERLRNILNRNTIRRHLSTWAENSWLIACLETACNKATKTISRRRLRNSFNRYKAKVAEIKREEYIEGKVVWFQQVREKKLREVAVDAWISYVKRFKQARVFLLRSIKGVDRLIKNEALTQWKSTYFQARRDVYHTNIAELQRR